MSSIVSRLDHLVLTTRHVSKCVHFYARVLGMQMEHFGVGGTRIAFKFGHQKINVHEQGKEFEPKASIPTPGSLDLCFLSSVPLDDVIKRLSEHGVTIEEGPVVRTGALSQIRSVYVRDPDQNLIEISEPLTTNQS